LGFFGIVSPPLEKLTQLVLKDVPQLFCIADLTISHTNNSFLGIIKALTGLLS